MAIAILAAKTGRGHISVMESIFEEFSRRKFEKIKCYPTFYEDMMFSNKILSDFYNFLMTHSVELCNKFCEYSYLSKSDLNERFYEGTKNFIMEFIQINNIDIIISVSHTINPAIMRVIRENNLKVKYYIVITDPFNPIAVGFAAIGAERYYCATDCVQQLLLKAKIDIQKINISGYPLRKKFLNKSYNKQKVLKKLNFVESIPIILINCGSQGSYHYLEILQEIIEHNGELQVIFIAGYNTMLYIQAQKLIDKVLLNNKITILPFMEDIERYINASDIIFTKPGANSIFEALALGKPILVDGIKGYIFQEKGIVEFMKLYKIGEICEKINDIIPKLFNMLKISNYKKYKSEIERINIIDGATYIVDDIYKLNNNYFN